MRNLFQNTFKNPKVGLATRMHYVLPKPRFIIYQKKSCKNAHVLFYFRLDWKKIYNYFAAPLCVCKK